MGVPVPVFVVGSGRSGTTIMAALLNLLPRVFIAKETGFIGTFHRELVQNKDSKNFASLIPQINSWLEVNGWQQRGTADGLRTFCDQHGLSGAQGLINYIWQLEARSPWAELSYIGDNTPLYVMAIPALLQLFPNAKFIHMVRDPRDLVASVLKMRFGAHEATTAAMEWHHQLGCWLMAERQIPADQRLECRYEDLCRTPEATFERIAVFLGANADDAREALMQHAAGGLKATGFAQVAQQGHHRRLSEPLNPARLGRDRSDLSAKQIRDIESVAQYGLRAYGYEFDEWLISPLMAENRLLLLRAAILDFLNRAWCRLRGK